ncbi:MAG: AtpZ/AtpI family protein [Acidobacteriota bacterium]|nr:AtpZ/AtpI family protein [Acidobacteriota bacterium]
MSGSIEEPHDQVEPDRFHRPTRDLPGVAVFATMGMTIALCEAGGVALGLWIDHALNVAPGGLLFGVVLGTVVAVLSVVKQVRRFL